MTRPNILVILCDQLRRRAVGCYGDPNNATPNIDALARSGIRFSQACSTYPICVPFRFTFMTGEYAHSRYIPAIEWRMSPAERTIADERYQNEIAAHHSALRKCIVDTNDHFVLASAFGIEGCAYGRTFMHEAERPSCAGASVERISDESGIVSEFAVA